MTTSHFPRQGSATHLEPFQLHYKVPGQPSWPGSPAPTLHGSGVISVFKLVALLLGTSEEEGLSPSLDGLLIEVAVFPVGRGLPGPLLELPMAIPTPTPPLWPAASTAAQPRGLPG